MIHSEKYISRQIGLLNECEAWWLKHGEGMTYREVGEFMGIPTGTASSYAIRARDAMEWRPNMKHRQILTAIAIVRAFRP